MGISTPLLSLTFCILFYPSEIESSLPSSYLQIAISQFSVLHLFLPKEIQRLRCCVSGVVYGERGDDDARADRVDPRATLAPANCLGHDAQRVPALRELVRVKRVRHLFGPKEGKTEQ